MTATIPLMIAIGSLLAALVLLWMWPTTKAEAKRMGCAACDHGQGPHQVGCIFRHGALAKESGPAQSRDKNNIRISVGCDAEPALAGLRAITAELQQIAALSEKTGVRLDVKQTPPESDRLKPAQAKQHKPAQQGGQRRRDGGKPRNAGGR